MDPKNTRKVYAPYSTSGEQVGQTPLTGYVDVAQAIYPAVNTGQVSTEGEWSGVTVSDKTFTIDTAHLAIPNGAVALSPQKADADFIDMTGYNDIIIAFFPTNAGSYAISAVMGPDTNTFANLTPIDAAQGLIGNAGQRDPNDLTVLFTEDDIGMTANVWNMYYISNNLRNQKMMQIKITNNSGGNSDITFAYMRLV